MKMNWMTFLRPAPIGDVAEGSFVVVHPLDDVLEEKVDTTTLGLMPMTTSVRFSLMVLRGYLIVMMLLVLYHVMDLAGAFGHAR